MSEGIAKLIIVLEEQRSIQASLVSLSERKIEVIASGDVDSLQTITEEEKEILSQIGAVEQKQTECVEHLAAALAVPAAQVRLSLVIEKAKGIQREKLCKLRDELTALVDKQLKYNEMNMKLLEMNMDYIQYVINKSANQHAAPTYGNSGNVRKLPVSSARLLDRKV